MDADPPARSTPPRAATWIAAAAGAACAAFVLGCVLHRFAYPFELTKMEGGFSDHARWAAEGRAIHGPPSAQLVPFLYMPLAHHVGGWLVRLGLDGFAATRIVSILGIAGSLALGMLLVRRATGSGALAWLVPGLACARYFDVECFYDQARPDNLMTLFCMGATFAAALPSARLGVPLFAACGALAFFTKQSSLFFLAVLLAGWAWKRWRAALPAGALLALVSAPLFFWLDARSGGWMKAYTFTIGRTHWVDPKGWWELTRTGFLGAFAVATVATAAATFATLRASRWRPSFLASRASRPTASSRIDEPPAVRAPPLARHAVLCGALAAAAFTALSSTQKQAVRNIYVIFAVAAAALVPVAWHWFASTRATPAGARRAWIAGALLLALDQARGLRDPRPWVPTPRDVAVWRDAAGALADYGPPETTWVMLHGSAWGGERGDPFHLHFGALLDCVGGRFGDPTGMQPPRDLLEKVARREYAAILRAGWDRDAEVFLREHYQLDPNAPVFHLPTFGGYRGGDSEIWVPKPAP